MEIFLDKKAAKQIRLSAAGAVEDGDLETLREDIMDSFSEEQIEEIERRIDSGDFYDFIGEMLDEWSGEDPDELFELLETQLSEVGIEVKYAASDPDEEEEEPEAEPADTNEEPLVEDDEEA
jgi:hypothetical protein